MPDGDLNDFLTRTKERGEKRVDTSMIQSIMHQVLLGLDHIHLLGYMHRDLKPENILMNGSVVKVADFSLVRRTATLERKMTSYVSTRWYRAPELILCAPEYTTAVDMFALGCIMAELYLMFPLFPGNEEIDQLSKILQVLGPLQNDWPEGVQLSKRFNLEFQPPSTQTTRDRLEIIVKTADSVAISFLLRLLDLNPSRRPSTREAMADEYFGPARSVSHNYFTTGQYEQPTFEPSAEQSPTTTPLKNSFANDLVPTVSISPNARNNISADRAGAYYGCYSNTSVAPSCFDPLDYDPRQEISLSSWQSKKRRTGEYRPSQAFNID